MKHYKYRSRFNRFSAKLAQAACITAGAFYAYSASAQTLTSNQTGTHDGFYYSFWKDTGDATFGLREGGRYTSEWGSSTNNWVGGKGWNPGGPKVVNYSGSYNVDSSQNSYLALYGWTRNPLIEYYVIESYGSYDPSSCSGGTNYGSFQSDGATYNVRRCERVQQPSIEDTATFYQYFSVRSPKKGFGNISGTITVSNHFNYWASQGLNLGNHDYMVLATEGYQSRGSSDITVSEGSGGSPNNNSGNNTGNNTGGTTGNTSGGTSDVDSSPSSTDIVVRASGANGDEHINLLIDGAQVADWTLSTTAQNYVYTGRNGGTVQVEYDNDADGRDVVLDWVFVNGETREAEDMEYNTATYDGECGGGSYAETMHCSGVIGFGGTGDCFTGACNNAAPSGSTSGSPSNTDNTGGNTGGFTNNTGGNNDDNSGSNNSGSGGIIVRAQGTNGDESISLRIGGSVVQTWTLSTNAQNYSYSGNASGEIEVEFTNDDTDRDVILDYVSVNDDTRQAEDMEYNTATYGNGECGGGEYSETMHCSGVIGFGNTSGSVTTANTNTGGDTNNNFNTGGNETPANPNNNSNSGASCQCDWYGSMYPVCQNSSGWGWENNQSCISESTCNSQDGNGGLVCN